MGARGTGPGRATWVLLGYSSSSGFSILQFLESPICMSPCFHGSPWTGVLSCFSRIWLCNPKDCMDGPLSMGSSRQECWSGLGCQVPCRGSCRPRDGKRASWGSCITGGFFMAELPGEARWAPQVTLKLLCRLGAPPLAVSIHSSSASAQLFVHLEDGAVSLIILDLDLGMDNLANLFPNTSLTPEGPLFKEHNVWNI